MRRLGGTALVVGLALAVGIYAFVFDTAPPEPRGRDPERHILPIFSANQVSRITVSEGGKTLLLERPEREGGAGEFVIRGPIQERADDATVLSLLRALENGTFLRRVERKDDLGPPRTQVAVAAGSRTIALSVYGPAPQPSNAVYVAVDRELFVVASDLAELLAPPLDRYRDPHLLQADLDALASLDLTSGGVTVRLVRDNQGAWRLPSGLRAGRRRLRSLLASLDALTAERFVDVAPEGTPSVQVTFEWAGEGVKAEQLRFYKGCGGDADAWTVARDGAMPTIACVASSSVQNLVPSADELEDRYLFETSPDEVSEIVLEGAGHEERTELARVEAVFRQRTPTGRLLDKAETEAVRLFLDRVLERGGRISRAKGGDRRSFLGRITVVRRDVAGHRDESVALFQTPEGLLAERPDGVMLEVSKETALDFLVRDFATSGRPVAPPEFDVRAATVIDIHCESIAQRVTYLDGKWMVVSPVRFPADRSLIGALLETVDRQHARAFLPMTGAASVFHPSCRLAFAGPTGARQWALDLMSTADGLLARAGEGPLFETSRELVDQASEWLVDRSAAALELSDGQLTLSARGAAVRWSVSGGQLTRLGGAASSHGEQVTRLLRKFVPTSTIRLGPALPSEGFARPNLTIHLQPRPDGGADTWLDVGAAVTFRDVPGRTLRARGVPATFFLQVTEEELSQLSAQAFVPPSP